jgi:hypothetical protein
MNNKHAKPQLRWTLLLLLLAVVQGLWSQTDKIQPEIHLSSTELSAQPNQDKFTVPTFTIKDGSGNAISSGRFSVSYSIEGGTLGTDADGKSISTDPTTGTTITSIYGGVVIGSKAGTVKVNITATPNERYAGQYESATASYTITIGMITPTVTLTPGETMTMKYRSVTMWGNTSMANTTSNLSATVGFTDTSNKFIALDQYYTVGYSITAGADVVSLSGSTLTTLSKAGTATVTVTLTPKSGYESTFAAVTKTVTVNVAESADAIKLKVKYPKESQMVYWGDAFVPLQPIVTDEFGNVITVDGNNIKVTYSLDDSQDNTGTNIWNATNAQAGTVGTAKIGVQAIGNEWNAYGQLYATSDVTYYQLYINARTPVGSLSPDPATITFSEGYVINPDNDFQISAKFTDLSSDNLLDETMDMEYGSGTRANGYYYAFYVPNEWEDDIIVTGLDDRKHAVTDASGNITGYQYDTKNKYGNNTGWSITFKQAGTYNLTYLIYPYNTPYYSVGQTSTLTFHVDEKMTPTVKATPETIVLYKGFSDVPEPAISVTAPLGKDVKSSFNLSYAADVTGVTFDENGNVTIPSDFTGTVTVTVTANPKTGVSNFNSGYTTYKIIVSEWTQSETFDYKIISTTDDTAGPYGKMVFTKAGAILGGTTINGVPGLSVRLGNYGSTSWQVYASPVSGRIVTDGNNAGVDADGFPTSGVYYAITPSVNGFLTIDGGYYKGDQTVLIARINGKIVRETYVFTGSESTGASPNADIRAGEHRFNYPLIAGNTYYLYNGGGATTNISLRLHGLSYEPAFILSRDVAKAITEATAFINGYTGSQPRLLYQQAQGTTMSISDETYATVSQSDVVTVKPSTSTIAETTVTVKGTVTSIDKTHGEATFTPSYSLRIVNVPVYVVPDGYTPSVDERVTTTNIPTAITMTYGGWEDGKGPYEKTTKDADGNITATETLLDSWKIAKLDSVGRNGSTFFVFPYASFGGNNGLDENMKTYNQSTANTFNLPTRGTYVRFEPRESGALAVYVLQNGCVDYDYHDPKATATAIKWRPLYIVDETGQPVTVKDDFTYGGTNLFSQGATTNAELRAAKGDLDWDWTTGKITDAQKAAINTEWEGKAHGATQNVIRVNGGKDGYVLLTKGYARYLLDVKAGKSYYLFMNASKMGFCGFAFMPTNFPRTATADSTSTTSQSLDEKATTYTGVTAIKDNTKAQLNRSFTANKWNSICLPFSVSETKFKEVFGEDAMIISFDSIGRDSVAHFTQHVYHMIEAGRPYFIRPTKEITALEIDNVTFEPGIDPADKKTEDGNSVYDLTFTGTFTPVTMPAYSYAIYSGLLKYKATASALNGFRAYLRNNSANANAAKLYFGSNNWNITDDTATGIEELDVDSFVNSGVIHSYGNHVYNMQGQVVRQGTTSTAGLPAGLYIVNGKKIVVSQ